MVTNGLLITDPGTYPHLLLAGTSGSGKTRSGLDFLPLQEHANAHTVLLEEPTQAIEYLSQLYEITQERFIMLRQAGVSTWGRLLGSVTGREIDTHSLSHPSPGPRILAVMDEFANLADALPQNQRKELWRSARMIAAEGRKAGVHLALALQDPTHKSLDLRSRRNCLPLSFRVKDGDASRVILGAGGAEQLPPRQFMTVMNQLLRGAAFALVIGRLAAFWR